jgi:hypothetical protein
MIYAFDDPLGATEADHRVGEPTPVATGTATQALAWVDLIL